MEKVYTRFQTKRPKNHTLWGGTTYMAYIRGYPPPGIRIHRKGHIVTLTLTYELSFFNYYFPLLLLSGTAAKWWGERRRVWIQKTGRAAKASNHQRESALVHFLAITFILLIGWKHLPGSKPKRWNFSQTVQHERIRTFARTCSKRIKTLVRKCSKMIRTLYQKVKQKDQNL